MTIWTISKDNLSVFEDIFVAIPGKLWHTFLCSFVNALKLFSKCISVCLPSLNNDKKKASLFHLGPGALHLAGYPIKDIRKPVGKSLTMIFIFICFIS